MRKTLSHKFAQRLYERHYGAHITPRYLSWRTVNAPDGHPMAVLGYRPADSGPIFVEKYLDEPVEQAVSTAFGLAIARSEIVEIGCLAATPSPALVRLWQGSAQMLEDQFSVTVATLTAPLRQSFTRVGLPFVEIVPARRERIDDPSARWGSYYDNDPIVCAGLITHGVAALERFTKRLDLRA